MPAGGRAPNRIVLVEDGQISRVGTNLSLGDSRSRLLLAEALNALCGRHGGGCDVVCGVKRFATSKRSQSSRSFEMGRLMEPQTNFRGFFAGEGCALRQALIPIWSKVRRQGERGQKKDGMHRPSANLRVVSHVAR